MRSCSSLRVRVENLVSCVGEFSLRGLWAICQEPIGTMFDVEVMKKGMGVFEVSDSSQG